MDRRLIGATAVTAVRAALRRGTCLAAAAALALAMGATACSKPEPAGEPRIDMSSDEAAARSIERVRETLDEEQRKQLADATVILVRHNLGVDRSAPLDPTNAGAAVKKVLDGKTAAEVIAEAQKVEAGSPAPAGGAAPPAAAPTGGAPAGGH
jgi:hypothetical protein